MTRTISGYDENFKPLKIKVIHEKSLTIFLNNQEIVTLMTIGDHPKYLAIGYLLNQNMLKKNDIITKIDYDNELNVVVIRTKRKTNYEKNLQKKITTSGCALGTIFGDIYNDIKKQILNQKRKLNTLGSMIFQKKLILPLVYIWKQVLYMDVQ